MTSKIVVGTIVLVFWAIQLLLTALVHGEYTEPRKVNFWATLIAKAIDFVILAIGGFWFFM